MSPFEGHIWMWRMIARLGGVEVNFRSVPYIALCVSVRDSFEIKFALF